MVGNRTGVGRRFRFRHCLLVAPLQAMHASLTTFTVHLLCYAFMDTCTRNTHNYITITVLTVIEELMDETDGSLLSRRCDDS